MVKAGDSWVFQYSPLWRPPDLNGTGISLEHKTQLMTSYVNSSFPFSPSLARLPGFAVPGIPDSNFHQTNATAGSIHYLASHFQAFAPALNPSVKENVSLVSHEPDGKNPGLGSLGKTFLIFDVSEKGARLTCGSSSSLFQESEVLGKKACNNFPVDEGKNPTNLTQFDLDNPLFQEECGEDHVDGERSEMHEDTEEVNALLYSDDDGNPDVEEDGDEEDEVTSTWHIPSVPVQCCGKRNQVDDTLDGVGNFSHMNKRQKPNGIEFKCLDSSLIGTPLIKLGVSNEHKSDADSSFVMSQANEDDKSPAWGGELSKKDKIHHMMKILEGIVPGAEGKDPIIVLDEAIEYLKTVKLKAKVLGMDFH